MSEVNLDHPEYIILVDRSIRPEYPEGTSLVERCRFLERSGPPEFDLSKVNRMLNLQDGLGIQKNPEAFLGVFGSDGIFFLYGSVVKDKLGNLYVPRVSYNAGSVEIEWEGITQDWGVVNELVAIVRVY